MGRSSRLRLRRRRSSPSPPFPLPLPLLLLLPASSSWLPLLLLPPLLSFLFFLETDLTRRSSRFVVAVAVGVEGRNFDSGAVVVVVAAAESEAVATLSRSSSKDEEENGRWADHAVADVEEAGGGHDDVDDEDDAGGEGEEEDDDDDDEWDEDDEEEGDGDDDGEDEDEDDEEEEDDGEATTTPSVPPRETVTLEERRRDLAAILNLDSPFPSKEEGGGGGTPFDGISIVVHRNGEGMPCGRYQDDPIDESEEGGGDGQKRRRGGGWDEVSTGLLLATERLPYRPSTYTIHEFDSVLTRALALSLLPPDECGPVENDVGKGWDEVDHDAVPDLIQYCDMGEDHTPVQRDHDQLVPVYFGAGEGKTRWSHGCHFHAREGERIGSLTRLAELARSSKATTAEDAARGAMGRPDDGGGGAPETCDGGGALGTRGDDDDDDVDRVLPRRGKGELRLYAVPAGRHFVYAPVRVGETFVLERVPSPGSSSSSYVSLTTLSLSPRVFELRDFFAEDESERIVRRALGVDEEGGGGESRMQRSTTGSSVDEVNSRRTSENAWDERSDDAVRIKRRCFDVLGFSEYLPSLADGLQVLRYNRTKAYVPHNDAFRIDNEDDVHDHDSSGVGTNRFATILMYLNDVDDGDGGETVFVEGWPTGLPEEERVSTEEALETLRASDDVASNLFERDSWEETMLAQCRTRLAIRPRRGRAVLFYSQRPNGERDDASRHGGCPVLDGEKWAANLWVWNGPREGYDGAPVNEDAVERQRRREGEEEEEEEGDAVATKKASFVNTGTNPSYDEAELYYGDERWDPLGKDDPKVYVSNTVPGHVWNLVVGGEVVERFVIDDRDERQEFVV